MSRWSSKTMSAIQTLINSVEDRTWFELKRHEGQPPSGHRQDYEGDPVQGIKHEWVDQTMNGGFSGDDFAGTVTFILGDYHLIVHYHC